MSAKRKFEESEEEFSNDEESICPPSKKRRIEESEEDRKIVDESEDKCDDPSPKLVICWSDDRPSENKIRNYFINRFENYPITKCENDCSTSNISVIAFEKREDVQEVLKKNDPIKIEGNEGNLMTTSAYKKKTKNSKKEKEDDDEKHKVASILKPTKKVSFNEKITSSSKKPKSNTSEESELQKSLIKSMMKSAEGCSYDEVADSFKRNDWKYESVEEELVTKKNTINDIKKHLDPNTSDKLIELLSKNGNTSQDILRTISIFMPVMKQCKEQINVYEQQVKNGKEEIESAKKEVEQRKKDEEQREKAYKAEHEIAKRKKIRHTEASKLAKKLKDANNTDFCFLMDVTGSMSSYIKEAKNKIDDIINKVRKQYKELKIRVAFVGYRDWGDNDKQYEVFDFSESILEFEEFVGKIKAFGGEDPPEDVLGGIKKALKLNWQNNVRIIYHILDAPPHGKPKYHDMYDKYPNGHTDDAKVSELLEKMMEKEIYYYIGTCNDKLTKMITEFKKESTSICKRPDNMEEWNISDIDLSKVDNLLPSAYDVITKTISHQTKRFIDNRYPEFKYIIETTPITSVKFESCKCLTYECNIINNIETCIDPKLDLQKPFIGEISKASNPFAKGSLRLAYYGKSVVGDWIRRVLGIIGYGKDNYIVLKSSKTSDPKYNNFEHFKENIIQHAIASYIGEEFNKCLQLDVNGLCIQYLQVRLYQIQAPSIYDSNAVKYMTGEPYVEGEFEKWNNNFGFSKTDDNFNDNQAKEFNLLCQAFSHFSYQFTNKTFLIVDVQGIRIKGKVLLTDPAFHSSDYRFEQTDLGEVGIEEFFKSHECNKYCNEFMAKLSTC